MSKTSACNELRNDRKVRVTILYDDRKKSAASTQMSSPTEPGGKWPLQLSRNTYRSFLMCLRHFAGQISAELHTHGDATVLRIQRTDVPRLQDGFDRGSVGAMCR